MLAQVLVTAVVLAVIASGLLRMLMQRHQLTTRVHESAQRKKSAQAALNRLISSWNAAGGGRYCADGAGGGESWDCTGTPGTAIANCACTCAIDGETVTASSVGGRCLLSVATP